MSYRRGSEADADTPAGVPSDYSSPYGSEALADELPGGFTKLGVQIRPVINRAEAAMILYPFCESPIEVILGAELLIRGLFLCPQAQEPISTTHPLLIPQYKFNRYRADFAVRPPGTDYVFVECDGHEFHSSDKDIARDREKDAVAARADIPVLRFTGSEIHQNPDACAELILELLQKMGLRR